jgi:parallel beta-helix repeat protein
MAGINQGRPETAIGEPIRFGDDLDFEIEQHPISDRLIIRDTANGKEAYVRRERGGAIGGDGVLIKSLREGKPVADDGRTHDTIQQAERAASSFVFVPPGTYDEAVSIDTAGLTLRGSGIGSYVNTSSGTAIEVNANRVTVSNLRVRSANTFGVHVVDGDNVTIRSIRVTYGEPCIEVDTGNTGIVAINCRTIDGSHGIRFRCTDSIMAGNIVESTNDFQGLQSYNTNCILANNIVRDCAGDGITLQVNFQPGSSNNIVIANRVINSGGDGIQLEGSDNIIANNRISDSTGSDINDFGTGTLLDANLTGASN